MGCLISRSCSVQAKAHPIKMLSVGVLRRNSSVIIQTPVKAAILFVPKHVAQVPHAVIDDWEGPIPEVWPLHHYLGRDTNHAAFKSRELAIGARRFPIAVEV